MKLTIITINLNNADGLSLTLESILNQTYTDFEHVIVDGRSSDESVSIIQQYEDKQTSVPVIWSSEPDKGIYHAMNKGIDKASGEYCFFLNSGDYLTAPQVLQNAFSQEHTEDVVFGNLRVYVEGELKGIIKGKRTLTFIDLYRSNVVKHQSSFIRKSLFERCGKYDEELKIIADFEFFMRTIGMNDATYKYIDLDIANFDNTGISNSAGQVIAQERDSVLSKYLTALQKADYITFEKIAPAASLYKYGLFRLILRFLVKLSKILRRNWV